MIISVKLVRLATLRNERKEKTNERRRILS